MAAVGADGRRPVGWLLLAAFSAVAGVFQLVLGISMLAAGQFAGLFMLPWVAFWYWIGVGAWRRAHEDAVPVPPGG
jgi:hypothetical protein